MSPSSIDLVQVYKIQLDLTDSFGASSSSTFRVTLYDPSSFHLTDESYNKNQSPSQKNSAALTAIMNQMKKEGIIAT